MPALRYHYQCDTRVQGGRFAARSPAVRRKSGPQTPVLDCSDHPRSVDSSVHERWISSTHQGTTGTLLWRINFLLGFLGKGLATATRGVYKSPTSPNKATGTGRQPGPYGEGQPEPTRTGPSSRSAARRLMPSSAGGNSSAVQRTEAESRAGRRTRWLGSGGNAGPEVRPLQLILEGASRHFRGQSTAPPHPDRTARPGYCAEPCSG
jgi:hypothetical protein